MKVKIKFLLKIPILTEDSWNVDCLDAKIEFERIGEEIRSITVVFNNQRTSSAPIVSDTDDEKIAHSIKINGIFENKAKHIVRRFRDYINLFANVSIDLDETDIQYIPEDDNEHKEIKLYSLKKISKPKPLRLPFSMLAQALFAGEGADDPSFASRLAHLARESFEEKRFIESFRYCFLLFESLYGNGQFKKASLIKEFKNNNDFCQFVSESINNIRSNPHYHLSPTKALVDKFKDHADTISYIVDQRGFYFHGNILRSDAWHPERQEAAQAVSTFSIDVLALVSSSFSSAMFTEEIGSRYRCNAEKYGAIMKIVVSFDIVDEHGFPRKGKTFFTVPGKEMSSLKSIEINIAFLEWASVELQEWASVELQGTKLISSQANFVDTGDEIFRCFYTN